MSDITYKQDAEVGEFQAARGVSDPLAAMRQRYTRVYKFRKMLLATGVMLADAMAADVTAESLGFTNDFVGLVTKIRITAVAAVVGDAANNAVVTVSKRDAAGANLTTLGTYTTNVANTLAARVPRDFALVNANLQLVALSSITWSIAKGGTGVILPIFEIEVHVLDQ